MSAYLGLNMSYQCFVSDRFHIIKINENINKFWHDVKRKLLAFSFVRNSIFPSNDEFCEGSFILSKTIKVGPSIYKLYHNNTYQFVINIFDKSCVIESYLLYIYIYIVTSYLLSVFKCVIAIASFSMANIFFLL